MSDASVMEITADDRQLPDFADVEIVTLSIARAVVPEFAVLDSELRRIIVGCEYAVLVVDEPTVSHPEEPTFVSDSRAVTVGHVRAREIDAFDSHVVALNHPDGFAVGCSAVSIQSCPAANRAQSQVVLLPCGHVSGIGSGLYLDRVAVVRDPGGVGDSCYGMCRPDTKYVASVRFVPYSNRCVARCHCSFARTQDANRKKYGDF
jgi:hypothetical protein